MLLLEGHNGPVLSLAYSADGATLGTGGLDGLVKLWDAATGRERLTCAPPIWDQRGRGVVSVALAPEAPLVAAGYKGPVPHVWDTTNGRLLRALTGPFEAELAGAPTLVAFLPDGALIVARPAITTLWDAAGGKRLADLPVPGHLASHHWGSRYCTSLATGASGRVARGEQNRALVWESPGAAAAELHWPTGPLAALAFSPDGAHLATARGRSVALWALANRRRVLELRRHEEPVRAVSFTPDGRWLLTAGDDWNVRVWDVGTGERRAAFNWRLGEVRALAASPDGMTAATAGARRPGVLIWDLEW
jgi:WD40 repeat protein